MAAPALHVLTDSLKAISILMRSVLKWNKHVKAQSAVWVSGGGTHNTRV